MRNVIRHLRFRLLRRRPALLSDEAGATAVEYAVMLAAVLLVTIGSIVALGTSTSNSWQNTNTRLNGVGFGS